MDFLWMFRGLLIIVPVAFSMGTSHDFEPQIASDGSTTYTLPHSGLPGFNDPRLILKTLQWIQGNKV